MDIFQDKKNLYKVRQTILEMISDRGISIPLHDIISFEEFEIKYSNKNLDIFISDSIVNKHIYVYFHNDIKNFSKNDLKNLMQKLMIQYENKEISILLLLKDKENSAISKELTKDVYKNVEIFLKNNMIFNITHHELQPKFYLLNKDEEMEVLEKYNTTKGKLPKISKNDPISKYYGAKSDQIFKILRKSPEVGEYPYYRLVR
jgi:DNA-directed RNA polymerases I, II, and III subunit RPABC1